MRVWCCDWELGKVATDATSAIHTVHVPPALFPLPPSGLAGFDLFLISPRLGVSAVYLEKNHVLGLQTFWPLPHLELHRRAFIQTPVSIVPNRRKMNKHIIATGPLDESIAFSGIKPLDSSFFLHLLALLMHSPLRMAVLHITRCHAKAA